MADFTALKTAIQNAIKQNGNEEITGAILQEVMLAVVSTLGDSAINDLVAALNTEVTNRQNADGTLQSNINAEQSARQLADSTLQSGINNERDLRITADNALQNAINAINTKLAEGYVYVGIATTSTNPSTPSGKVFYIAVAAGSYTNFLNSSSQPLVLIQGINILKYNGTSWSVEQIWGVDDKPVAGSDNLVKSGGLYKWFALYSNLTTIPQGYYGYDKAIKSISKSDYNITLSLNKFLLTGNVVYDIAPTSYVLVDKENIDYTIPNVNGLFLDIETKEISVVNINGYNNLLSNFTDNKVLLFVNIYGELVSPIPTLQSEIYALMKGTKYIKLNDGEIGDAINDKLSIGDNVTENVNISSISSVIGEDLSTAGATLEKIDGNEFNAKYAEKLTIISGSHYLMYAFGEIKECEKIKFIFKYKCNKDICVKLYLWGNGGWINNEEIDDYAVNLPATNGEVKIAEVWRPWQNGIEQVKPFFQQTNSMVLPVGTILEVADTYVILHDVLDSNNNIYNEIIVAASGGDFTSVRAAVESISDNSPTNRYNIIVKNGTYEEIDIMTKDYVDIIGESREGVLLWVNGDSTDPAPSDYHYEDGGPWDGVPINEIPRAGKHLFIHNSNSTIENMTLKCTDTKYVIHQDGTTNQYEAIVRNCIFIREEAYNALNAFNLQMVGIGAHGGQYQRYYNCSFFMNVTGFAQNTPFMDLLAVGWHNWRNESMSCGATFKDCNIYGAHFINIHELNSGKDDVVEIDNVVVDNAWRGAFYTLETSGITPETAAYNIKVNITNSKLHFVILGEYREGGVKYVLNPENIALVGISSNVSFGQPVSIKSLLGESAIATSAPFGFAYQDANANEMCYINTGSVGRGLCVADTYSYGDAIYINNGKFTKTANGQQVGTCLEAKTLSGDGLVLIGKV